MDVDPVSRKRRRGRKLLGRAPAKREARKAAMAAASSKEAKFSDLERTLIPGLDAK